MSQPEPTNPPYPQERTPEQHAAVRRRALPLGFCALVCGILALVLLLLKPIDVNHPPNVLAVNLSFCALLMGAGIIFYARGTSGTGAARAIALAGLLAGLAGPAIFAKQTVDWRKGTEGRELENVSSITRAANAYAVEHNGQYPPNLLVLLEGKYLTPESLISPFAATAVLTDDVKELRTKFKESEVLSTIDAHSDYTYSGGDLVLPSVATSAPATAAAAATRPATLPPEIIVAYAKFPVMRVNIAVAYVDGNANFVSLEEAEAAVKACNDARVKLGLPALARPESVERALRPPASPTPGKD